MDYCFCFYSVFFPALYFFSPIITCWWFLPLVLAAFIDRVVLAGLVRFCLLLLCSFYLLICNKQYPCGGSFGFEFLPLVTLFLLVSCSSFWFAVFLLFTIREKYRRPGPCGHFHVFLACPPYCIDPLRPSPPFVGIYAPPVLCVCLLFACMCVFGHMRMLLGRGHVGLPACTVHKSVC